MLNFGASLKGPLDELQILTRLKAGFRFSALEIAVGGKREKVIYFEGSPSK